MTPSYYVFKLHFVKRFCVRLGYKWRNFYRLAEPKEIEMKALHLVNRRLFRFPERLQNVT